MSDYETLRAMLARAHLSTTETADVVRGQELHIAIDARVEVLVMFDADGALVDIEIALEDTP